MAQSSSAIRQKLLAPIGFLILFFIAPISVLRVNFHNVKGELAEVKAEVPPPIYAKLTATERKLGEYKTVTGSCSTSR